MHTFQQKVTMLGSLFCALRAQVNISLYKYILIKNCETLNTPTNIKKTSIK